MHAYMQNRNADPYAHGLYNPYKDPFDSVDFGKSGDHSRKTDDNDGRSKAERPYDDLFQSDRPASRWGFAIKKLRVAL